MLPPERIEFQMCLGEYDCTMQCHKIGKSDLEIVGIIFNAAFDDFTVKNIKGYLYLLIKIFFAKCENVSI